MNARWIAIALTVLGSTAWAQVGELYNADITENPGIDNPAKAVSKVNGQWLAFEMPVLDNTRSPCCWKGRRGPTGEVGCSLKSTYTSYGSRSDSPLTETVVIYSKITDGKVKSLRVFGKQCRVDGNGEKVTWLSDVDQPDVLEWLEDVARGDKSDGALYALSMHQSDDAARRLYSLAKDIDADKSSEAIFWLGEARGEQGFRLLKKLLAELPISDRRREVNFALAMNDSPDAAELLYETSRNDKDPEQRGEALFWLAQEYPEKAAPWLREVISTEQDEDVLDQAIFAVSQLPGNDSSQMLLEIAQDKDAPREARRQALFWLAQSDDDEAVAALADLLTR